MSFKMKKPTKAPLICKPCEKCGSEKEVRRYPNYETYYRDICDKCIKKEIKQTIKNIIKAGGTINYQSTLYKFIKNNNKEIE